MITSLEFLEAEPLNLDEAFYAIGFPGDRYVTFTIEAPADYTERGRCEKTARQPYPAAPTFSPSS